MVDDTIEDLQAAYISEIRALKPELFEWWMKLTGIDQMNDPVSEKFDVTWPVKLSGHPRMIEIFRRYYMKIEDLNDSAVDVASDRAENRSPPKDWMEEPAPPTIEYVNPVDLLVWDIQDVAPDIFKLAAGIVYVPVGLNQHDRRV